MIVRLSSDRAAFDEPTPDLDIPINSGRHPAQIIPFFSRNSRRPSCRVPGCSSAAAEALLCHPHRVLWKHAGAPETLEAWADAYAAQRDASGATRIVPVRFFDPRKRVWKQAPRVEQEVEWDPAPEEDELEF